MLAEAAGVFFDEPDEYFATLTEFLEANRSITSPAR